MFIGCYGFKLEWQFINLFPIRVMPIMTEKDSLGYLGKALFLPSLQGEMQRVIGGQISAHLVRDLR